MNSCTAALHTSFAALNIGPDELSSHPKSLRDRERRSTSVQHTGDQGSEQELLHLHGATQSGRESWTRNCCLRTAVDALGVAEAAGHVAGYVGAGSPGTHSTLFFVATAKWARGRGAAHRASLAALHWFSTQGMLSVEVRTQLRNIPAARLYEGLGFRVTRTSLTFRRII